MISTNAASSPALKRRTSSASYSASWWEAAARAARSLKGFAGRVRAGFEAGALRGEGEIIGRTVVELKLRVLLPSLYLSACQPQDTAAQSIAFTAFRFPRVKSPMAGHRKNFVQAARSGFFGPCN